MELKISEIRKLCNLLECKVNFFHFLSDTEVNQFRQISGNSSCSVTTDDGLEITQALLDAQQRFYDDLDIYIKFLQALAKYRPLPF